MVSGKDNNRTGQNCSSQGIHRLESLQAVDLSREIQQCEQSVVSFDKTAGLAVSILYHLSDYLTSEQVRVYSHKPIDLIALCSARIAEMERMQETDELRRVGIVLHPFSSIKDVEEIIVGKI